MTFSLQQRVARIALLLGAAMCVGKAHGIDVVSIYSYADFELLTDILYTKDKDGKVHLEASELYWHSDTQAHWGGVLVKPGAVVTFKRPPFLFGLNRDFVALELHPATGTKTISERSGAGVQEKGGFFGFLAGLDPFPKDNIYTVIFNIGSFKNEVHIGRNRNGKLGAYASKAEAARDGVRVNRPISGVRPK